MCALISVSLGLIPLWLSYQFVRNPQMSDLLGYGLTVFTLNAAIAVGILISAFLAWKGNATAKKSLFALVWLHVIGIVLNNANVLMNPAALGLESLDDRQITKLLMNIGRAAIWLVLIHWYFNTQKAKEYFKGR